MKRIIIPILILLVAGVFFILFGMYEKNISNNAVENPQPNLSSGNAEQKKDKIVLDSPKANEKIKSPLNISGKARGTWFFEASFPVNVVDWDGKIIGEGVAQAEGEWMTENFVPFTATVNFTVDPIVYSKKGTLILKKDNPSGMPENDDALEIPIEFE